MGRLYDPRSRNLGRVFHGRGSGPAGPITLSPAVAISSVNTRTPALLPGTKTLNAPVATANSTVLTPSFTTSGGTNAALIQSTQSYPGTSVAFPSNVTAGSLLVAMASWNDAPETDTPTISGWTALTIRRVVAGAETSVRFFYKANASAGATTVSLSGASGGNDYGLVIAEFSGIKASPTVVEGANFSSGGTSTPPGSITTTVKSLIVTAFADENALQGTITAGTGYTLLQKDESHAHATEYKVGVAAGTVNYTFNLSGGSNTYVLDAVAFEEA